MSSVTGLWRMCANALPNISQSTGDHLPWPNLIDSGWSLNAANGSSNELIGSVDLHFRFSGPSLEGTQSGKWTLSGLVMQYWYPACAAIFGKLSMSFIMSASLLHTYMMQVSYANMPGPTVTIEQGKNFPFYNQLQLEGEKSSIPYPRWQVFGEF